MYELPLRLEAVRERVESLLPDFAKDTLVYESPDQKHILSLYIEGCHVASVIFNSREPLFHFTGNHPSRDQDLTSGVRAMLNNYFERASEP